MPRNLWCQADLGELGERKLCRKPTEGGAEWCPACDERLSQTWPR